MKGTLRDTEVACTESAIEPSNTLLFEDLHSILEAVAVARS